MPSASSGKKPRILISGVGNKYGGTETVVSRFIGALSGRFAFDTICHGPYKQPEYTMWDNRVITIPAKRMHPLSHAIELRKFFRENCNSYSALWHNANSFSNIDTLELAADADIPVRICHFHNTQVLGNPLNKALSALHKKKAGDLATVRLACSAEAGQFAYGNLPFSVVNNAFELNSFVYSERKRFEIRNELGLVDKFVIGNVGRLAEQKNQSVLINSMPLVLSKKLNAVLVIVGDGPLKQRLLDEAKALGVEKSVYFVGTRLDVNDVLSAFDVFAFPSLFEGLGVAVVEAQVNGLPCVVSNRVPSSAIVSNTVNVLPPDDPAIWADRICSSSRDDFQLDSALACRYELSREAERLAELFDFSVH